MPRQVTVTTGARLHFGPFSYRPERGRHFGGAGMMIDRPGVRTTLTVSEADEITGVPEAHDRVSHFVNIIREQQSIASTSRCRVDVESIVPFHAGLGSGTQLGLAVARGLAELSGDQDAPIETLAMRVERGRRSAVGIYGFQIGGLIVDAGLHKGDNIGALACRLPFPEDWRVLLITPPRAATGLSGDSEEQAFQTLGLMPSEMTDRLSRLVLSELLPAVTATDFEGFSRAVYEYGSDVGQFFRKIQGGVFGDSTADRLVEVIRELGIDGIGQTSWGPTLFAFVQDDSQAKSIAKQLRNGIDGFETPLAVEISAPLNRGATVVTKLSSRSV